MIIGARQHQEHRPKALQRERPPGNSSPVQQTCATKEEAVLRHRIAGAPACKGERVDGAERRHHDEQAHCKFAECGKHGRDYKRGHTVIGCCLNGLQRQYCQIAEIAQKIEDDDQRSTDAESEWKIALRIADLTGNKRNIVPRIRREERAGLRNAERYKHAKGRYGTDCVDGNDIAGCPSMHKICMENLRMEDERDRSQCKQCHDTDQFRDSEHILDEFAPAYSVAVDDGNKQDYEERCNLRS